MSRVDAKQVSFADIKQKEVRVVEGAEGHIRLEIHKNGNVQTLETNQFNFYIESWRTVIEAFFGEDTGSNMPAVALWAYRPPLEVGKFEIDNPFNFPDKVSGIFGRGRPGAVAGDGWGKGILRVEKTSSEPSDQYIQGGFEFIYEDIEEKPVKVVAKEFWAKYSE